MPTFAAPPDRYQRFQPMSDIENRQPAPTAEFHEYPPILDTAGAAQMLGLKIAKLQELCRDDQIPYRRLPGKGRVYHFLRDDLVAWFDGLTSDTSSQAEAARTNA